MVLKGMTTANKEVLGKIKTLKSALINDKKGEYTFP